MLERAPRHPDQDATLLSALARDIQLITGKTMSFALLQELLGCSPAVDAVPGCLNKASNHSSTELREREVCFAEQIRRWSRQARCLSTSRGARIEGYALQPSLTPSFSTSEKCLASAPDEALLQAESG
jgi:hypothetical protein